MENNLFGDVLLVEVSKKLKINGQEFPQCAHEIGLNRITLENFLKNKYKVELPYNPAFAFPYFTDGGFYYQTENDTWEYTFIAHPYNIIK